VVVVTVSTKTDVLVERVETVNAGYRRRRRQRLWRFSRPGRRRRRVYVTAETARRS
jgi:hypothetical protein